MISWLGIFIFSMVVDIGAVLFTRSVHLRRIGVGMMTTGTIAAANWLSILLVVKENGNLIVPSIIGHMAGFVVGMLVPLSDGSGTAGPTTGPGSQSSDPS